MIREFLDVADIWGWYLFFAVLQLLVVSLVSRAYRGLREWLDRDFPDDMPMTTGEWVRGELARRGLRYEIDVLVRISDGDEQGAGGSYSPAGHHIWLGEKTFFKKDPTFWAVGAHELGHALMHHRLKVLAILLLQSRLLERVLSSFGVVFLLVNIAFGAPELTRMAYWLIVGSVLCSGLVIVDEAWASALALRMLKRDHRLDRRHWLGVLVTLSSAWCTYIGALMAKLILLIEFDYLARLLEQQVRYQAGPPLPTWQLVIVGALSSVLALMAFISLMRLFWLDLLPSDDMTVVMTAKLVNSAMLIPLVLLIWNQSEGPYWVLWVALASRPLITLINLSITVVCIAALWLVRLPLRLIIGLLHSGRRNGPKRFRIPPEELEKERAHSKAVSDRKLGYGTFSQWTLRWHHLINLVYVPLLLAFWIP